MLHFVTGQFNDSFQPVMDGVANVVKNYAYWLNRKYGKGVVVTPAYPQYVDREDYTVLRYHSVAIPKRPPYRLGVPRLDLAFMKKMNRIPFDIVHAHCPFTSGQIALYLARKRGIPIVATFHSKYYDDFKEVFKVDQVAKYLLKRVINFYNSVDFVWTVNEGSVETMRSYGFKGEVDILPNGTDFVPPADLQEARRQVDQKLGIKPDKTVLLFVGQHIWQKNVRLILESLGKLKAMNPDFLMVFAGTGYAELEMKELTKELGLQENIVFLGLVLDREFLKSLYARASLFLFPSVYDNAPIVIREAAAVGCPPLLIEGSNAAEGIRDGYNGFLTVADADAYAKKIHAVLSDRQKLEEVGEMAQKTVYRNWESIVDEVALRYNEIIKSFSEYRRTMKL